MNAFAIDFRSLRLFRSGLGVFLITDVLFRLSDFIGMYTDLGAMPNAVARALANRPIYEFSLFYLSGSPWWSATIFASMLTCGALLVTGVAPRITSVVAFALAISLKHRNGLVNYGGDDLFRVCLIWSAFMPSGPSREGEKSFANCASIALFIQLVALYLTAGMNKTIEAWFYDPRGAYMALNGGTYAKPLAGLLLKWPDVLAASSIAVFLTERFGWLLFFSPWRPAVFRTLGVAVFAAMHISFAFFLHLELFPLIDVILVSAFLPSEFWDWLKVHSPGQYFSPLALDKYLAPAGLVLATILAYVSLAQIPQLRYEVFRPIKMLTSSLSINQAWSMFSPIDKMADGYHRIIGRSEDGRSIDMINGKVLTVLPAAPVDIQKEQNGFRWTRFLDEASAANRNELRTAIIDYFCRKWREKDQDRQSKIKVDWYYFSEQTVLAPGLRNLQEASLIYRQPCPN